MKWPIAPLGKLTKMIGGGTPSKSRDDFWNGDIPWVSPKDMSFRELYDAEDHITKAAVDNSTTQLVPAGSVLMVVRSGILVRRFPVAIARVTLALNQDLKALLPGGPLQPEFLAYALAALEQLVLAQFVKRGATVHSVDIRKLQRLEFPVPAKSEQRQIVEILDQADALRKRRAEADDRAARILPALFYKMFGDPSTNPKRWPTVQIRELVKPIERRDPACKPDDPFIYIDIAGVDGQSGTIGETRKLLGADAPSRARQIIRKNDVIISTVRPYLRATALVPPRLNEQICSTGFCVLRAKDGCGFGFLYALSRLHWFTNQLNARARGASYPAVTDKDILDLNVPQPGMARMHEAFDAQILDVLALQDKLNKVVAVLETLFSSLLHRAFTGDLTAKWREVHMKELLVEMEAQAKVLERSIVQTHG